MVIKLVCNTKYNTKLLVSTGGTASTSPPMQPDQQLKSSPDSVFEPRRLSFQRRKTSVASLPFLTHGGCALAVHQHGGH